MGQTTHGRTYSKIYRTWIAMLSRCRNPKDNNYSNYGGRGITVCERWYSFENFYEDMGDLPFYEAQIDRIDNEKGYYKENCRWVNCKENSRNRRSTKRHNIGTASVVQAELIEKIGWNRNQWRWFVKRYGIAWIIENFQKGTLPIRTNETIDRDDLVGQTFGKWKVLKFAFYTKKTGHLYLCQCECGTQREIPRDNLRKGKSSSCRSCAIKEFWKERKSNP